MDIHNIIFGVKKEEELLKHQKLKYKNVHNVKQYIITLSMTKTNK